MAILKKDMCFGEGISSYGEIDPQAAFNQHRRYLREKRLDDLLGRDAKTPNSEIGRRFQEIAAAIEAADKQAVVDNAAFIEQHSIHIL
jgi:hypothetical protein